MKKKEHVNRRGAEDAEATQRNSGHYYLDLMCFNRFQLLQDLLDLEVVDPFG